SHRQAANEVETCKSTYDRFFGASVFVTLWSNPVYGLAQAGAATLGVSNCIDQRLLEQAARNFQCTQPDCPGFYPDDPQYGPCYECSKTDICTCCPYAKSLSGYVQCNNVNACCDPTNGCGTC